MLFENAGSEPQDASHVCSRASAVEGSFTWIKIAISQRKKRKKERKKEIPHPAFRILLHTWFVSLEKSQLELEDYSIVKSSLQKNFISTILFFLIK